VIKNVNFEISDNFGSANQCGKISRIAIVWFAIAFLIIPAIIGVRWVVRRNDERARADWKAATLQRLAGLSVTNEEIRREIAGFKASATPTLRWTREHVLLMTNGEYLIYAFRHGQNDGSLDHLFLAHASDGRWLYSSFHFCNSMVAIMSDAPPGSIREFEKRYAAREFEGKSNECLKHTWPAR